MTGASNDDTLLLYAPVPLHRAADGTLLVELQAANGLRLWAENFSRVIVMMPLSPDPAPPGWVPLAKVGSNLERVRFEPLPMAYRPDQFLRRFASTRRRIRALIAEARWLSFAIGGLFGDWGAVAGFAAHGMGRPFAVWTDRVESEVVRRSAGSGPWKARLRARLTHRPMARLERAVIRRAALGLFHGRETYDTYAPFASGPCEVVHDIHLAPGDHIARDRLSAKTHEAGAAVLRLVYTGRADPMKGPLDWIAVLERLAAMGVDFEAQWLGDGEQRPEMLARIARAGLQSRVALPGFVTDRAAVLEALRGAHAFLFCHLTPESPRCLIEALASGCPIVGYDSGYPADLIAANGGGVLVPMGDTEKLACAVARLDADRASLSRLVLNAAADGAPFTDEKVFAHRAEVIRRHLGAPDQASDQAPDQAPYQAGARANF